MLFKLYFAILTELRCHRPPLPSPSSCLGSHWSSETVLCSVMTHHQSTACMATCWRRRERERERETMRNSCVLCGSC